jgi:hypothetical protein
VPILQSLPVIPLTRPRHSIRMVVENLSSVLGALKCPRPTSYSKGFKTSKFSHFPILSFSDSNKILDEILVQTAPNKNINMGQTAPDVTTIEWSLSRGKGIIKYNHHPKRTRQHLKLQDYSRRTWTRLRFPVGPNAPGPRATAGQSVGVRVKDFPLLVTG